MDTSQEYIKMCEKAEEIQSIFKADEGDFYYCFCKDITPNDIFPNGYGLQIITKDDADYHYEPLLRSKTDIWLPRQDQLQDIVYPNKEVKGRIYNALVEVRAFLVLQHNNAMWSMEILWLTFVMKRLYGKHWTGENWEEKEK